ncbi:uncharacterized protein LOC135111818 [Scylla paramamosain]|uniref:uncharacterized protein LOC135111818 n=1 Tax=Scylla paramamosain TaxID=85552 RepID=UPI0030829C45
MLALEKTRLSHCIWEGKWGGLGPWGCSIPMCLGLPRYFPPPKTASCGVRVSVCSAPSWFITFPLAPSSITREARVRKIIKEFLRLEPQADEPDPRVAVLKGLEKYRLPIIAILRKRKAVPLYMETLLELYDHDESQYRFFTDRRLPSHKDTKKDTRRANNSSPSSGEVRQKAPSSGYDAPSRSQVMGPLVEHR